MSHMYSQNFYSALQGGIPPAPPCPVVRPNHVQLILRQQPTEALVSIAGKEKTRKPIDPPPMIELRVNNPADPQQQWLQSPYFFVVAELMENGQSKAREGSGAGPLIGTLTSSLHRLKDTNNRDGGFFIFADISAVVQGTYNLRFSLFELQENALMAVYLGCVESRKFKVVAAKDFKGMQESTVLSRSFSDQGVRLRLRKEPRGLSGNTKRKCDINEVKEKAEQPMASEASSFQETPSSFQETPSFQESASFQESTSSFEESVPPNKRFKQAPGRRKDSHAVVAHNPRPPPVYPAASYTTQPSYTTTNHASSRYNNTLPEPPVPSLPNFTFNMGIQGNFSRSSYQPQLPITSPAVFRQSAFQASANSTMPTSLPQQQAFTHNNSFLHYDQPQTRPNDPLSFSFPDNNDFDGSSQFPQSQ